MFADQEFDYSLPPVSLPDPFGMVPYCGGPKQSFCPQMPTDEASPEPYLPEPTTSFFGQTIEHEMFEFKPEMHDVKPDLTGKKKVGTGNVSRLKSRSYRNPHKRPRRRATYAANRPPAITTTCRAATDVSTTAMCKKCIQKCGSAKTLQSTKFK